MASCSPAVLIAQAACFQCLSDAELARIKTQALCDYANTPIPPTGTITLTADDPNDMINWVIDFADPTTFETQFSADGITGWTLDSTTPGSDRTAPMPGNPGFMRVIAHGGPNDGVISNVVAINPA